MQASVHIHRYEQALFKLNRNELPAELKRISGEYGFFIGDNYNDAARVEGLKAYLEDTMVGRLFTETNRVFPNLDKLENDLSQAFAIYSRSFPGDSLPQVFSYISGLDYEAPVRLVDSVMIIALDMYLGSHASFYREMRIPAYLSMRFQPAYIPVNCMEAIAVRHLGEEKSNKTLLDWMVREGKLLYFLDVMLPSTPDSLKIAYTGDQLSWCSENEHHIWGFLISNKLLYTTREQDIMKFIGDAPFTKGFPKESPGRLGCYTGWQIVRAYMKKHDGVSLAELMQNTDSQQILNGSGYKPGK